MIISKKKSQHVASALSLGGRVLEIVNHYKYLGFYLPADLSWSYHIQCICTKARKIMGILYRQFSSNVDSLAMKRLYTSLVRPHLEYGVEVWNPYLQKDIAALENVQKFALRVCSVFQLPGPSWTVSSTISSRPPIVPFSFWIKSKYFWK